MTSATASSQWRPTRAWLAAVVAALAVALVAIAVARPDAVALVAPVVAGGVLAAARQRGRPTSSLTLERTADVPPGRHRATIDVPDDGDVRLRVSVPQYRAAHVLLAAGSRVSAEIRSGRTGPLDLFRCDWVRVDAGFETLPGEREADRVVVEPGTTALGPLPLPDHLVGLTGAHTSRRRGDGDDLHDIAPFRSGDRLRRIDWRVTARRGTADPRLGTQLYVRRTQALAEAAVVIALDSRDDVGVDVRTWAGGVPVSATEPTSLDVARGAAATLARAYLDQGDRVGRADLGTRRRPIAPGSGRRHLARIVHALALTSPEGEPAPLRRAPQIPAGALVVVVSTFLDPEAAAAAEMWAAAGHRVLAVDVLTPPHTGDLPSSEALAARLVLAERVARLRGLERAGVDVVPWHLGTAADGARASLAVLARGRRGRRGAA